jgi:hypothetical protein
MQPMPDGRRQSDAVLAGIARPDAGLADEHPAARARPRPLRVQVGDEARHQGLVGPCSA